MAGRKPSLNWTKSRRQYTVTVAGRFHLLGTDKDEAERQYRFLLNKHDLGDPVEMNPTFGSVADQWLEFVRMNHEAERYRLCKARLEEFRPARRREYKGPRPAPSSHRGLDRR